MQLFFEITDTLLTPFVLELPTQFGLLNHLIEFRASFNKLKRLPPEIGRLEALQEVKLSNNFIKDLPPEMGNCKSLRILDLSSNSVRVLNPNALKMDPLERVRYLGFLLPFPKLLLLVCSWSFRIIVTSIKPLQPLPDAYLYLFSYLHINFSL